MEARVSEACPFHGRGDDRKSADAAQGGGTVDPDVRTVDFAQARAILRNPNVKQAGFLAEQVGRIGTAARQPILFLEGEAHRVQRSATARFFTPRIVTTHHRELMADISDQLISRFVRDRTARLDQLSLELAVAVAGHIVGLTDSDPKGLARRLDIFFTGDFRARPGKLASLIQFLRAQYRVLSFYYHDVAPAIRARRKQRRDDVISHLIDEGYNGREILTECLVYAAAGMATTREFIVMAAWYMLERDDVKTAFLAADEKGKIALLEELLRLEPVVGYLYRRMPAYEADAVGAPAGAAVAVDVRAANTDPAAFGDRPCELLPGREVSAKYGNAGLSFGDGEHRCPGAQVALQESCIFLERLLQVPGVKLVRTPLLAWNPLVTGYELRNAHISCA